MGRGPDRTSAHIIFCCSLHRCKYSIHIVNNMPRTVHRAHAAGNTFLRVDDSVIFRHMNSSRWTFLLTDSAGDAGVRTDVFRGFSGIRVRVHGDLARIEASPDDIALLSYSRTRKEITDELKKLGFRYVTLDMQGYRMGSMNDILNKNKEE